MNSWVTGHLFGYLVIGAALILASLQLGGEYDFIAAVRDLIGYETSR